AFLEAVLGPGVRPFDDEDYRLHVDGKPRYDGVESFLKSRGLDLPPGDPDDPPGHDTVRALGNRKNERFGQILHREGVEPFPTSVAFVRDCRAQGLKTAVVSSSRNCGPVLEAAGIQDLFDTRVDGIDAARQGLPGKPAPAIFLEAARRLGIVPDAAAVLEDALAGVEAGRAGGFRTVVGVDRTGRGEALRSAGAGIVVQDLGELELTPRKAEGQTR
ncbi:MAG: HAD-IA family hydrolase, partial [Gammaproteobacteria bacterium]|nr:HAD-IA family hydrolase [Gemmatimonadota bacterium]NIU80201.1 HAD-IA family hydrolase [Gammaproteobacteria bacterium]